MIGKIGVQINMARSELRNRWVRGYICPMPTTLHNILVLHVGDHASASRTTLRRDCRECDVVPGVSKSRVVDGRTAERGVAAVALSATSSKLKFRRPHIHCQIQYIKDRPIWRQL